VRTLAALLLALVVLGGRSGAEEAPSPAPPGFAGEEMCASCHADLADAYAKTPHARPLADPARPEPLRGCEACHGPGATHAESGGSEHGPLQTFAKTAPAQARSVPCL
jgi:hypothetical protein